MTPEQPRTHPPPPPMPVPGGLHTVALPTGRVVGASGSGSGLPAQQPPAVYQAPPLPPQEWITPHNHAQHPQRPHHAPAPPAPSYTPPTTVHSDMGLGRAQPQHHPRQPSQQHHHQPEPFSHTHPGGGAQRHPSPDFAPYYMPPQTVAAGAPPLGPPHGDGEQSAATLQKRLLEMQHEADQERERTAKHAGALQETVSALSAMLEGEKARSKELERRLGNLSDEMDTLGQHQETADRKTEDRFQLYKDQQQALLHKMMAQQKEEFQAEKERLNEHYRDVEEELKRRQRRHDAELAAKDAEMRRLEEEKEQLKKAIEDGKTECEELVAATKELREELVAAQRRIDEVTEEKARALATLRADREKLEQTIDVLVGEFRALTDAGTAAERDAAEKTHLLTTLKMKNQTLSAEGEGLQRLLAERRHEGFALHADLDRLRHAAAELKKTADAHARLKYDLELGRCAVLEEYNNANNLGPAPGQEEEDARKKAEEAPASEPAAAAAGAEGADAAEGDVGRPLQPPPAAPAAASADALLLREVPDVPSSPTHAAHAAHVLLNVCNEIFRDVLAGLRNEVIKLRLQVADGGGGATVTDAADLNKLTVSQLERVKAVSCKAVDGATRGAEDVFHRGPGCEGVADNNLGLMQVRYHRSSAGGSSSDEAERNGYLFKVLERELEAKPGDVLDELMGHLVAPDFDVPDPAARKLEILAEAAGFLRGASHQSGPELYPSASPPHAHSLPYPELNLMDLLLLRLYTVEGPEVDNLLFHNDVPSFLNVGAYKTYKEGPAARNKTLAATLEAVLARVNEDGKREGEIDEAVLTELRPYLKIICLLLSLSSEQHTSDAAPEGGVTLCAPIPDAMFARLSTALRAGSEDGKRRRKRFLQLTPILASTEVLPSSHAGGGDDGSGADRAEPQKMLFMTNVRHGRYLQNISMFPKERTCLVAPGCFFDLVPDQFGSPFSVVVKALDRLSSPHLSSLILKAKADSARAAARLEQVIAERDATSALAAMRDRFAEQHALHRLDLQLSEESQARAAAEVSKLSEMVVKYAHASSYFFVFCFHFLFLPPQHHTPYFAQVAAARLGVVQGQRRRTRQVRRGGASAHGPRAAGGGTRCPARRRLGRRRRNGRRARGPA